MSYQVCNTDMSVPKSVSDAWIAQDIAKFPKLGALVLPEEYECYRLADLTYANRLCDRCCESTGEEEPCFLGVYVYDSDIIGENHARECGCGDDDDCSMGYWPERELMFRRTTADAVNDDWHRWFCPVFLEHERWRARESRSKRFARLGKPLS